MTIHSQLLRRLFVVMVGVASLGPALFTRNQFKPPWVGSFDYSLPSFSVLDKSRSIYTIDQSLGRITKVNRAGELVFVLHGHDRSESGFFHANEIYVDEQERLYVLNTVPKREGFYTEREDVLVYNPNGRLLQRIYSKTYNSLEITNHNITRSRMVGLHQSGEKIGWFELSDAGVIESQVDMSKWRLQQNNVLRIPNSARPVASVARLNEQDLVYSLKSGMIFLKRRQEPPVLLYSGDDAGATGRSTPWWLARIDDKHLLFTDIARSSFVRLSLDGDVKTLVNAAQISDFTGDDHPYVYYSFGRSNDAIFSTVNDIAVIAFEPTGKLLLASMGGRYTVLHRVVINLFWLGLLLLGIGIVLSAKWVYVFILQRRTNLAYKQLLVILPVLICMMALILTEGLQLFNRSIYRRTEDQLSQLAQLIAASLDARSLQRLSSQQDITSPEYEALRTKLHRSLNFNRDSWNRNLYFALHRISDSNIYTMMYLNDAVGMFHPFSYLNDSQGVYWQVVRSGIKTTQAADPWGLWLLAVAPIVDADNNTVALIEVGRDMYSYQQEVSRSLQTIYSITLIGLALIGVFLIFVTWLLFHPLRQLKRSVNKIREGNWESDLKVRSHDEVAELTVSFNAMVSSIRSYIQEIVDMSAGYQRFVPQQFLSQLNRANVTQIKLGDQIQSDMTILFSDIRSFTQISEKMSPKENFDFINRYLGMIGPLVRQNDGFIDKYIGDAIMALYPSNPEQAIVTAIQIQETLQHFNQNHDDHGFPAIAAGIGIHTGTLVLGILGEPERFDGSVISDNVNLASRLEGLTKFFEASILVSEQTMAKLVNKDKFLSRYVGKVKVKGKAESFGIYEILDGLPRQVRIDKTAVISMLESGISAYQLGDLIAAEEAFEQVLATCAADRPAQIYLRLIRQQQWHERPEDWDGVVVMDSK